MKGLKRFGLTIILLFIPTHSAAAADGEWQVVAFKGQSVSLVQLNERRPNEVAAVAEGRLWLTQDNGLTWQQQSLSPLAQALAFDPLEAGRLYVGTTQGLYVRSLSGEWRLLESQITQYKSVVSVVATPEAVYAVTSDGAGINAQLFRFNHQGSVTALTYPANGAVGLAYAPGHNSLYLTTANGLFGSEDGGATWCTLNGLGHGSGKVQVSGSDIWETTGDGVYYSPNSGSSWQHLGFPGLINNQNYGNDLRLMALTATRGVAITSNQDPFSNTGFLVAYEAGTGQSLLSGRFNSIAAMGPTVWAASTQGLWRTNNFGSQPRVRRPLVVVPGILGSMPVPQPWRAQVASYIPEPSGATYYHTDLVLDPILQTYDPLISHLEAMGYRKGQTLFAFPYNWRQDNRRSAEQLGDLIADIRHACGCVQVDVVAHSMGGLVARAYASSNTYHDDVANLITIGTPSDGSPESYPIWEAGDFGSNTDITNAVKRAVFQMEALAHGYLSLVDYIRNQVPAVGQLLPTYDYIEGRHYPSDYPPNAFLDELNGIDAVSTFRQRPAFHEVGSDQHQTAETLQLSSPIPTAALWPHGRILDSRYGPGDGAVPLRSLQKLESPTLLLGGDHRGMVAQSELASFIHSTLLGEYRQADPLSLATDNGYIIITTAARTMVVLHDPLGRELSSLHQDIPQAYYSGEIEPGRLILLRQPTSTGYTITLKDVTEPYVVQVESQDSTGRHVAQELSGQPSPNGRAELYFDRLTGQLSSLNNSNFDVKNTSNNTVIASMNTAPNSFEPLSLPQRVLDSPAPISATIPQRQPHLLAGHSRPAQRFLLIIIVVLVLAIAIWLARQNE